MEKLTPWADLSDRFRHTLILGNGASISISDRLQYTSLFDAAKHGNFIMPGVQSIFDHFKTCDFEFVLQSLSRAFDINSILGIDNSLVANAYSNVKASLIDTVRHIHPEHQDIEGHLDAIVSFTKSFEVVFSLNYDLIMYWAMIRGNEKIGKNRFKDCFLGGNKFTYELEYLRRPYRDNDGATLVFYPHGSLLLGTDAFGEEAKIICETNSLIETISSKWTIGDLGPLFVSEGTAELKLRSIRRNGYLNYVYSQEIPRSAQSLVIYGWSMAEQDTHIVNALKKAGPKRIAVSVYIGATDWEDEVQRMRRMIRKTININESEIFFFDSAEKGAWCH